MVHGLLIPSLRESLSVTSTQIRLLVADPSRFSEFLRHSLTSFQDRTLTSALSITLLMMLWHGSWTHQRSGTTLMTVLHSLVPLHQTLFWSSETLSSLVTLSPRQERLISRSSLILLAHPMLSRIVTTEKL